MAVMPSPSLPGQKQVYIMVDTRCVPFLQKIFAMRRLFFPGPSSMATSHLSMVVTLSRSRDESPPPVRVRKTESNACEGGQKRRDWTWERADLL